MEKIAINLNRLKWCCNTLGIDIHNFHTEIKIAESSIKKAINGEAVFSIKQLSKIAKYFNQNLLFFLEPDNVIEDKIYSPQFRTINNKKPIKNKKLLNFIKNAEKQRKVYLNLLDDLQIPIINNWKIDLNTNKENIKKSSQMVRKWLEIKSGDSFSSLRNSIETKGVMIIVSNGYNGVWQIDKKDSTRGFCLNYETLPIIVIKKQESKGAQAFTLMHELAHLLLHKESMIDEEEDFYNYQGKEREANEIASNVLIPDEYLNNIDLNDTAALLAAHERVNVTWQNYVAKNGMIPGSDLDVYAQQRGSNFYLPETIIHMLPTSVTRAGALGATDKSNALSFSFKFDGENISAYLCHDS
jgi:Zn-dependent peptidase ImmA (M78 family)